MITEKIDNKGDHNAENILISHNGVVNDALFFESNKLDNAGTIEKNQFFTEENNIYK